MKRLIYQFALASLLFSLSGAFSRAGAAGLEDWTLADVLAKVIEANGGQEVVDGVSNVRILGVVQDSEASFDFVLLKKRPDRFRIRLMYLGRSVENGYDGTSAWRRLSIGDKVEITDITGDDLIRVRQDADFDGPLIGPESARLSRSLKGMERIDRVDYFIVDVLRDGTLSRHYVDSRTYREDKVIEYAGATDDTAVKAVTRYSDYKRHGGVWVAMRVERDLGEGKSEVVVIREVEINPGIFDWVFKRP